LRRGLARPGAHGLGFATVDGALLQEDGSTCGRLFAVGLLRRGELFETTAMPELRVQARAVARRVLEVAQEVPQMSAGSSEARAS
jgi:uncharacterized NAD(P)/FAD-binding protein YdhS